MTAPPPTLPGLTVDSVKSVMGVLVFNVADDVWLIDCVNWVSEFAQRMQTINHLSDAQALWGGKLHV